MENIINTPLPIDDLLAQIVHSVTRHANVVLTATPGAGKTTRLPPRLLDCVPGKILVLQPRRLAAVSACERVCFEQGWTVGDVAGYQVRFESRLTKNTRLIFMTDAMLLRQLIGDPELNGVDLVVIDEFHERSLNQDLTLGCLRELQDMGRAIKIVIMSATLDVPRTLRFLPDSVHVDVPGRVFPLDVTYATESLRPRTDREFFDRLAATVQRVQDGTGDILVFLPGVGEINRLRDRLVETGCRLDIVPLHGSLPLKEQRAALKIGPRPRVVLSTNVAEASVTVPGVNCVVDSGLAKVSDVNPRTGFGSLDLVRIAQFNARQRAGRAARERPGRCYRMWSTFDDHTMDEEPTPEAARVDLSQALLILAHLGVTEFTKFTWFDPPPAALVDFAIRSLKNLGALGPDRRLTDLGRDLVRYPLPPRWGGLLAAGGGEVFARAAALLNERDFADRYDVTTLFECDVTLRLELLDEIEAGQRPAHVGVRAAEGVLDVARQLRRLARGPAGTPTDLRKALLLTQKDRLCRRRGPSGRGVMVGGRGVRLSPNSQVRSSEFFVALQAVDVTGQPDSTVRIASGFTKDEVLSWLKSEIVIETDIYLDEDRGAFMYRRRRRFGDLELDEPTVSPVPAADVGDRLMEAMKDRWPWLVQRHDGLKNWERRRSFLFRHAPAVAEFTSEDQSRFVELATFGRSSLSEVLAQDLVGLLEANLPGPLRTALAKETPASFTSPAGVSHRIHYEDEQGAFVEVRLQEMFGQSASPLLCFGRVPLTFRLLGPNFRPVQVTSDLANFWRSGYAEVRKELRARYPKHAWPEDPTSAKPEARGRRR